VDGEAEFPRVTPAMLRRADDMCRRRLAREHAGGKRLANRSADARFAVSNRLFEDAQLAHAEIGPPRADAFGDRPGRATDIGWSTHLDDLGVDLFDRPGLALDLPDGRRELRVLHLGTRHLGAPLVDEVKRRVALVRTEEWAPDQLTIVAADVIEQELHRETPDLARERAEAHDWIATRVELVKQLAADGRTKVGSDCSGCPFIAGCDRFRA